jgi:hypothetical protein
MADSETSKQPDFNSEDQRMRNALGGAISAWSGVEGQMCDIFAIAVTAKNEASAKAAFMEILSFDAQLDMVCAAINETFKTDEATLTEWKKLAKRFKKLKVLRNKLAHGQILRTTVIGVSERVDFLPFHHFGTHKRQIEYDHWSVQDLNALERAFKLLRDALGQFKKAIDSGQSSPQISLEPIPQVGRPGFGQRRSGPTHPSNHPTRTKPKPPPDASQA